MLDWATTRSAQYACKNWHYSGVMPSSSVKIGVWENGRFVGVILFGLGAGNSTRGDRFGLKRKGEVAELVRVALRRHESPVSKMIAIAIRMVKKKEPGLRLIISFADEMAQGHVGGIYQAGNWIYEGTFTGDDGWVIHGKVVHNRTVHSRGWKQTHEWLSKNVDPNVKRNATKKHRYLMPLDEEMRQRILPMARPYPKRVKQATDGDQPDGRRGSTDPHAPSSQTISGPVEIVVSEAEDVT